MALGPHFLLGYTVFFDQVKLSKYVYKSQDYSWALKKKLASGTATPLVWAALYICLSGEFEIS